jgi:predicted phage baseplate assembly protein
VALQPPQLDDRTFEDLLAEIRARIPRYAPEWQWNDFNEVDPGITFGQLYAWLFGTVLYRFNRVPDVMQVKFLELLGVKLQTARPARTQLTFALARDDIPGVFVPRATQVAASGGEGEPPVFETDETIFALGARLAAVVTADGIGHKLRTHADVPGPPFHAFGPLARRDSALMLALASPVDLPAEELQVAFLVHDPAETRWVSCSDDAGGLPTSAQLAWEFWDGTRWAPLNVYRDGTRALTRSGHVHFAGPGAGARRSLQAGVEDEAFWLRARVAAGGYEQAPQLEAVLLNTVEATQAITVRDEILGGSTGQPNMRFQLAQTPVVEPVTPERVTRSDGLVVEVRGVRLEIDEGEGFEVWQQVDDFLASGPDDPHYTCDAVTGAIETGTGDHGRIPLVNEALLRTNVVARTYRVGGGRAGNVAAGTITELQTFVQSVDTVTNHVPAQGGAPQQSIDAAAEQAARQISGRDRCVTVEDFEYQATQARGTRVLRAKALPLRHPDYPGVEVPGAVTVIVVPASDSCKPMPSEATLTAVCVHLNSRRLLTSEVYVVAPAYRRVKVEADLLAEASADVAEVKRAVEQQLATFFDPLHGGRGGDGWPFGGDVHFSEVYRQILDVDGVDRIRGIGLRLDGERQPDCTDLEIGEGVLVYSDGHAITVAYDRGEP